MFGVRTAALLVFLGLAACEPSAGEVRPATRERVAPATRTAIVELSAVLPRHAADERVRVDVSAHFVEARGLSREASLSLLGVWLPGTAADGCVVRRSGAIAHSADVELRLLDAGRLGTVGNGEAVFIEPRSMPPWIPEVSGWVYAGPRTSPLSYAWGEPFTAWVDGSDEVGAFVIDVVAPAPVELVALNGRPPDDFGVVDAAADSDLVVELDAGVSDSPAWLTVSGVDGHDGATIECRVSGQSRLTFDMLDLDGIFGAGTPIDVALRRVERWPLPASAGVSGEVVFSFRDRVEVVR
jgi:hypothetical protein